MGTEEKHGTPTPLEPLFVSGTPCLPAAAAAPAPLAAASLAQPFVSGAHATPIGDVPAVSSTLRPRDHLGTLRVRLRMGRSTYRVDPGLYALGAPDAQAPVLVTANYKLSFDRLRGALAGRAAWLLVLDTRGVNVWCAAGKGTFSTEEIARRVLGHRLSEVVSHRRLILPQLAAPGVAAFRLEKLCGFRAAFGPVRAEDLPAYLDAGGKIDPARRRKTFGLGERLTLIPVEFVSALKYGTGLAAVLFFLGGLGWPGGYWAATLRHGTAGAVGIGLGVLSGAILTPALLPWLPGRAFALKGSFAGLIVGGAALSLWYPTCAGIAVDLELAGLFVMLLALSAALAMLFTGSSTYTSLSGVQKEMRWAVPLEIAGGIAGLVAWVSARFVG